MKKVLVYPCGTEIGLEIFKSVNNSTHFELWGGSSSYDHGQFVYENHIENLPFITDDSTEEEIMAFQKKIDEYNFDYIYPAMDGVIAIFAKYQNLLTPVLISPDSFTSDICRSKFKTYNLLKEVIKTPKIYNSPDDVQQYPVFIKPDSGQGSVGARLVNNKDDLLFYLSKSKSKMIILENLPFSEYTIDCFTNSEHKLIFSQARCRKRIKTGISVNTYLINDERIKKIAEKINSKLNQKGAWFFQLKENQNKEFVLLEVAARIAGTSGITRALGVNLPLMTLHLFDGHKLDYCVTNDISVELDRAFKNVYRSNVKYDTIYFDFDDTFVVNGKVNLDMVKVAYSAINKGKKIKLITKHQGNLKHSLELFRLNSIFDEVIHISKNDEKFNYMKDENAIFIDDSFVEREKVKKHLNYIVLSPMEAEFLVNEEYT